MRRSREDKLRILLNPLLPSFDPHCGLDIGFHIHVVGAKKLPKLVRVVGGFENSTPIQFYSTFLSCFVWQIPFF